MYQLLCVLSGVILACAITTNGSLTGVYGPYVGAVITHIVGTVVAYIAMKAAGQTSKPAGRVPLWVYSGGIIGILTTVFQSLAFNEIGVTPILALSLFGQTVTALITDGCGWFGMEKRPVTTGMLAGVAVSMGGIVYLLVGVGDMKVVAMLMAMSSGVASVISRLINAKLSDYTTPLGSSFVNHWVGLLGCIVLLLIAEPDIAGQLQAGVGPLWIYLGGACGVFMIMLWNICGLQVSAVQVTLLSFGGQVFAGIGLDLLVGNGFDLHTLIGGAIVSAGVVVNVLSDKGNG